MKRPVLLGLTVISGAVLAAGWAFSPGCQGHFCLGADGEAEAERLIAPRDGPTAEELERIWAESAPERPAFETLSAVPAGSVAAAGDEPEPTEADPVVHGQVPRDPEQEAAADPVAAERAAAEAAERWAVLASTALDEPNPELRSEAVHEIGLHRNADSVAVLVEVVTDDPDPDNRYQALEQLWYSAASGLDGDGAIMRTLEAARGDDDEDIAELAERALADLAKLAQANN